ncbi:hypothetical protein D3C71_418460 [compost metagenome]
MTKTASNFIEECRTRARTLKAERKELGNPVSLGQAYELLAQATGYRTWAAMRAAGEAGVPVFTAEFVEDPTHPAAVSDRYFSIEVFRRISIDSYDAHGEFDVPELLKAAYRDLSYVFFDGEEYPSMRFRNTLRIDSDEYAVTVDVEKSPLKDMAWHNDRIELADNVLKVRPGPSARSFAGSGDALFTGSGKRDRDLPWPAKAEAPSHRA